MVKNTISQRNRDVADYMAQTTLSDDALSQSNNESPGNKSPVNSAMLAQQLATDSSWADRYVPTTPSESVMTPTTSQFADTPHRSSSVAGESNYATPDEAPPTYEAATSTSNTSDRIVLTPTESSTPSVSQQVPEIYQAPEVVLPYRPQTNNPPFVPGKHYERHETSGSINGMFTLHDSLDLSTGSGSINIQLDVKPGPNPAILKLVSKSGSIRVDDKQYDIIQRQRKGRRADPCGSRGPSTPGPFSFLFGSRSRATQNVEPAPIPSSDDPRKQVGQNQPESEEDAIPPTRIIHATIETSSGSVTAMLALPAASQTSITTGSGSIHLRMITTGSGPSLLSKLEREDTRTSTAKCPTSTLTTVTQSGSQNVWITTGASDTTNGGIVSALHSTHHARGSGTLHIHYPNEWMGLAHCFCAGSGHAEVRGDGLELDKKGNREVYAWRGVDLPDVERAVELSIDGSGSAWFRC